MSKPEFVYVTYIETTAEKLWQALTSSDFTALYWFGYRVNADWKVGSAYKFFKEGSKSVEGKVLESDQPRRLTYTWTPCAPEFQHEHPSRVTFDIEPHGNVVKLVVTHDGFDDGSKSLAMISQGWPVVLSNLKSLLEVGHALIAQPPGESGQAQAITL
jgi:uncharacterized protein YndB with AHSA1/START domain